MLLLIPSSLVFIVQILTVLVDFSVEVVHDGLIEPLVPHEIVFMTLKCLFPCSIFGRIVILNHSEVLFRCDITAII